MKKILAVALAVATPLCSLATVYDAHADFSLASNPNGVWSYGYSTSLGGAFTAFNQTSTGPYDRWHTSIDALGVYDTVPGVAIGSVSVPSNHMWLHPGSNAEYAIVRFTAPTTSTYFFTAGFFGVDFLGPTTTDVHILQNNAVIGNGAVNTFQTSPSIIFGGPVGLAGGDTLDIAVGFGGNSYLFDSTGIEYRIEGVPEPATMAVIGLAALVLRRKNRS